MFIDQCAGRAAEGNKDICNQKNAHTPRNFRHLQSCRKATKKVQVSFFAAAMAQPYASIVHDSTVCATCAWVFMRMECELGGHFVDLQASCGCLAGQDRGDGRGFWGWWGDLGVQAQNLHAPFGIAIFMLLLGVVFDSLNCTCHPCFLTGTECFHACSPSLAGNALGVSLVHHFQHSKVAPAARQENRCSTSVHPLLPIIEKLRSRIDEEYPGLYAWMKDSSLHCTFRALINLLMMCRGDWMLSGSTYVCMVLKDDDDQLEYYGIKFLLSFTSSWSLPSVHGHALKGEQ
eukprot:1158025-Pelagomonas_calceolata.AAC.7